MLLNQLQKVAHSFARLLNEAWPMSRGQRELKCLETTNFELSTVSFEIQMIKE
jgi:hypothetical protein